MGLVPGRATGWRGRERQKERQPTKGQMQARGAMGWSPLTLELFGRGRGEPWLGSDGAGSAPSRGKWGRSAAAQHSTAFTTATTKN